jgi:riboflavin kinase/FMN adenylyltransferase
MRTTHSPEESAIRGSEGLYVSLGNFDGFHVGHQAVIEELLTAGEAAGGEAIGVTFDPHPGEVVGHGAPPGLLTPGEEKEHLLASSGLSELLVVRFTPEVAARDARGFLSWIGVGAGSHLVLGYDFHMGRGRAGDLERLSLLGREIGFGLDVVPPVMRGGRPVSSTRVRQALMVGRVEDATEMLGRPYAIVGPVVRGDGVGARLGSPTANIEVPTRKLLPKDGVYLVSVDLGVERPGLLYVGTRPSLGGGPRRVEVHVLDHDSDLYGEALVVELRSHLRDDVEFADRRELSAQIECDVAEARRRWEGLA